MHNIKRKSLAISLIAIAISVAIIWFGFSMTMRIINIENHWEEFSHDATQRSYALSRIQSQLGYGGLIHNFKNYVLRHDENLIPKLEKNFRDVYQAIDNYQQIESTTYHDDLVIETKALTDIRHVVDTYALMFDTAKQMVADGRTIKYIDMNVKVDDQPAYDGIDLLLGHSLIHAQKQEKLTGGEISNTIDFMKLGGLIIPIVLLGGLIMIIFTRRIVYANQKAEAALHYVDQIFESAPDPMLVVEKGGQIIRTNSAAEKLLGYSQDEFSSLNVDALVPEESRHMHNRGQEMAFEKGENIDVTSRSDFFTIDKADNAIPVEINISFTKFLGSNQAVVSMRDITERKKAEQEILKSQARYRAVLDSTFQSIILLKPDGTVLDANNASLSFAGISKLAVMGRPYWEAPWWSHDIELQNHVQQSIQRAVSGETIRFQALQISANGESRYLDFSFSPVKGMKGEVNWIVAEGRDITELHKAEERLVLTEKVFDETAEAILVTDNRKRIIDMNESFSTITGYGREELLGQTPSILSSGKHDKAFYKDIWSKLKSTNHWAGEVWDKRKNGEIFPARVSISAVKQNSEEASHYVAVMSDITILKENEANLEQLAHYDQLTGLANRTLFYDRLQEEIARARRYKKYLVIMFIDLDGFKQVNDTLGHEAGDAVLIKASDKLKESKREHDVAARLGGDEFALILSDLDDTDIVSTLADRVVSKLQIQVDHEDNTLQVSGSIGVAIFPKHGEDGETLVRNADQAMYQAKQQGKNAYQIYS